MSDEAKWLVLRLDRLKKREQDIVQELELIRDRIVELRRKLDDM